MQALRSVLASLALVSILAGSACAGPLLKAGTTESSKYQDALGIECPEPQIPAELKEETMKTSCVARFDIKADGKSTVKIVSSSGSEQVDDMALATLRRWKFKPATLDGKPVDSFRRIRVEFDIN
jgi:protein TonB